MADAPPGAPTRSRVGLTFAHRVVPRRVSIAVERTGVATTNPVGERLLAGCEEKANMAKIVFGMNQSLDGYVDHQAFAPDPVLFRHFIDQARGATGSVYGRRLYEVMRYWDDDHREWTP